MTLQLCYSPLSPFCRKVRMAMDYKQLNFVLVDTDNVGDLPVWNPRAEVPVLIHGDLVVCNSTDILAYLDHRYPEPALYPASAGAHALVREWERFADWQLDPPVSVVGTWKFADMPAMPPGLLDAARADLTALYDQMQQRLAVHEYLCGAVSAADFAAYPHVVSAASLEMRADALRHPDVIAWMRRMRERAEGRIDAQAVRAWWAERPNRQVDTQRINWGTHRLEWLLAHGHADWFAHQVADGRVLWSAGPHNNALNSAFAPPWMG